MRIEILGSAAGGGFPQWNCNCPNCRAIRAGTFRGKSRTQTQIAVTQNQESWLLLNASPDLRLQIEGSAFLHPRTGSRESPIKEVIVTSGDIDQIAGLLSLRELQPFGIYCTPSIRCILQEHNSVFGMLNRVPNQVSWTDIHPGQGFPLLADGGVAICCSVFSLGSRYPAYVSAAQAASLTAEDALLGVILECSGKRLAYLPAVPAIDDALLRRLQSVDLLLFDGTFWSNDELIQVQGSGTTAREMGHVPISGNEGSLRKLSSLRIPRRIFVHINNTNPMLEEASPEFREIQDAGWEIAQDGQGFSL